MSQPPVYWTCPICNGKGATICAPLCPTCHGRGMAYRPWIDQPAKFVAAPDQELDRPSTEFRLGDALRRGWIWLLKAKIRRLGRKEARIKRETRECVLLLLKHEARLSDGADG